MSLFSTKRSGVDAGELRAARIAAARHTPRWTEISKDDLDIRQGVIVHVETDRILDHYRGAVFATGTANLIADFSSLYFVVEPDELRFYERRPGGSWAQHEARQARRAARTR